MRLRHHRWHSLFENLFLHRRQARKRPALAANYSTATWIGEFGFVRLHFKIRHKRERAKG